MRFFKGKKKICYNKNRICGRIKIVEIENLQYIYMFSVLVINRTISGFLQLGYLTVELLLGI